MTTDADDSLLFDYDLPRELIAQEPLANRADARLLVVDRASQSFQHLHFRDLPELMRAGDRLVVNDTRVLHAQLSGRRSDTGGAWRGLFLGSEPDGAWRIVCKTRGKLSPSDVIELTDREGRACEKLVLIERLDGGQWLAQAMSAKPLDEMLARVGKVPLPHYIRGGDMVDSDVETYQTVYARKPGAVAAPTAGLHFTEPLLRQLGAEGVEFSAVTLHVGLGTFRPISTDKVEEHDMHAEWCELTEQTASEINTCRSKGGRVVAVGTTAVRTLETAAAKSHQDEASVAPWSGETDLFIRPPYDFGAVDVLITNFHFPRTTLLLLVQAFGGPKLIKRAYHEAIEQKYRFYSYGDAMIIL